MGSDSISTGDQSIVERAKSEKYPVPGILSRADLKMEKRITIDFRNITDISALHDKFNAELGFPDFYGKNTHALIDCLQSIRFPEEGMSKVVLGKEEVLVLELINFSNANMVIINSLLVAVETVNRRELDRGRKHSILLALSFKESH